MIPVNSEIAKKLDIFKRIRILLEQDEQGILNKFCAKLPNEDETQYKSRKQTFVETFVNPVVDLVTAPGKSIFRQGVVEQYKPDNGMLAEFSKNVMGGRGNVTLSEYVRNYIAMDLRSFGNSIVVMDKPSVEVQSEEEERKHGMLYIYSIKIEDVRNWECDADGFVWFAYNKEYKNKWLDPTEEAPESKTVQCVWTRTKFYMLHDGTKLKEFEHGFGFVPVSWQAAFNPDTSKKVGNAAMFTTSNYIITSSKLKNVGVNDLYKHGAATMMWPESSWSATNKNTDSDGNIINERHDNDIVYEGDVAPHHLVKDMHTTEMKEWAADYMRMAYENERDQKSVSKLGATGNEVAESGLAKLIERDPLVNNLISLALDCESQASELLNFANKILNREDEFTYKFDKDYDFDTQTKIYENIKLSQESGTWKMSPTASKNQVKKAQKIFAGNQDDLEKINAEIDNYSIESSVTDLIQKSLED